MEGGDPGESRGASKCVARAVVHFLASRRRHPARPLPIDRPTHPPPSSPAPSPPAVVDVHQTWAGPCKAIQSTFKRIFFDHGDKPMKFYTADASKVTALNEHVGTCEPKSSFSGTGNRWQPSRASTPPGSPPSSSRRWASSSDDDECEREHQRAAGLAVTGRTSCNNASRDESSSRRRRKMSRRRACNGRRSRRVTHHRGGANALRTDSFFFRLTPPRRVRRARFRGRTRSGAVR